MKRTLLLILVIGVILLGACGAPTATEFVVTGLRVVLAPDLGENSYRISVDVENTGDLKDVYQLPVKIDDVSIEYYTVDGEQVEFIQVELNAGEKKTVSLSVVELIILGLGSQYKKGDIDQEEHTISVDGLSTTVTLTKSFFKLQLLSTTAERANDYITISGQVKNISDESLQNVQAIAEFYDRLCFEHYFIRIGILMGFTIFRLR